MDNFFETVGKIVVGGALIYTTGKLMKFVYKHEYHQSKECDENE